MGVTVPAFSYAPSGFSSYAPPGYYTAPYSVANGGFSLSFVGTLSDARRKAALAAAVAKARQHATELAEVAGGRIGDLWSAVSDTNHTGGCDVMRAEPFIATTGMEMFPRADQAEVASQSPDLPEFTVHVHLAYRFSSKTTLQP